MPGIGIGKPDQQGPSDEQNELRRSLGFWECFTIAVGTMLGAGIFVFPGMAASEAGLGATWSFLIGGLLALLVALPASELVTAMPESGGGYVFIARGMGRFWGCLVGIAQWVGLIFASAFYVVGFGHYLNDFLARLGLELTLEVSLVALGATATLFVISVIGTATAGKLQNKIVNILLLILIIFLSTTFLDAQGIIDEPWQLDASFWSSPWLNVLATTSLIFTSYLGFAQVVNVAGEVREPERTIPRAMISAIVVVTLVYGATMYLSVAALGVNELARLGETAIPRVAEEVFGPLGGIALVLAGVLATLSSANASIMGSSRLVFALSQDDLMPDAVGRVNRRFSTPHISLMMVAIPMAGLVWLAELEVLAEVASFSHLILYGLLGVCVILMRRRDDEYKPAFRAPASPLLPAVILLACLGLVALMQPLSQILGLSVIAAAAIWYWFYELLLKTDPPESESMAPQQ